MTEEQFRIEMLTFCSTERTHDEVYAQAKSLDDRKGIFYLRGIMNNGDIVGHVNAEMVNGQMVIVQKYTVPTG